MLKKKLDNGKRTKVCTDITVSVGCNERYTGELKHPHPAPRGVFQNNHGTDHLIHQQRTTVRVYR